MKEPIKVEQHTERTGLYIMVFLAMIASCNAEVKLSKVQQQLDRIEKKIELVQKPSEEALYYNDYIGDVTESLDDGD